MTNCIGCLIDESQLGPYFSCFAYVSCIKLPLCSCHENLKHNVNVIVCCDRLLLA